MTEQRCHTKRAPKRTPIPGAKGIGEILPKNSLLLRVNVGDATGEDGIEYELTVSAGQSTPMVKSNKTGQTFALGWKDIITLAIAAGVNNPLSDDQEVAR